MEPSSGNEEQSDGMRQIKRYGPIGLIALIAIIAGVIIATSGGDDDDGEVAVETDDSANETTAGSESPSSTEGGGEDEAASDDGDGGDDEAPITENPLPEGAMSFSVAEELGLDIDFGERCDPETGRVKTPAFFRPECWQPFEGDNGAATDRGVTADTIKIAWWVSQDNDPIMQYITDAIVNDDTNADDLDTMQGLLSYYETYYETYGRSVEIVQVVGSGTVVDEVSARADAVKIAEEIEPFMVWGGPVLTNAFADELAARGIPCISCGPGQTNEYYIENHPYSWAISKGPEQLNLLVAEYLGKRLNGDLAIHAGDESMHDQERKFGRIWIEASEASATLNQQFEEAIGEFGVAITESVSFVLDPATIQESAANIITRLKEAGVTSVIVNGDPTSTRDFTKEATAQNYFPEWVVTGSALIDTTAFSRSYDQEQWSNAFGVSNLSARVVRENGSAMQTYIWFNGERAAADDNIGVIDPLPSTFYSVLTVVGPDLTIENWAEARFSLPPSPYAVTAPQVSWGITGIWPDEMEPDYRGVDDIAEIWWDPTAAGPDEIDDQGVGMWRYVDGGARYLPGEIPEGPPKAFVEEGSVVIYDERPPEEAAPDYEPLPSTRGAS